MTGSGIRCPLCGEPDPYRLAAGRRTYWRCRACRLVHLDPSLHPTLEQERAIYDLHENSVDDPAYRRFLWRTAQQVVMRIPRGAQGLDFGCGPGPALVAMLEEHGYRMRAYDPFYRPDPAPLALTYDFITCTEVAEHLHRPLREFGRLRALLRPGGLLVVQTRLAVDDAAFAEWSYCRDPTHVSFYDVESFGWLARLWGAELEVHGHDVVSLGMPGGHPG